MGPNYYLVTLNPVSREELREFILEQGGELDPDGYYDGFFADYDGRLSVSWETDEKVHEIIGADNFVDTKRGIRWRDREYDSLASIAKALGGTPHDFMLMDLLHGPGSQRLAVSFVQAFSKRWSPCVLVNLIALDIAEEGRETWTMDDVFEFAEEHGRLPSLRRDIPNWSEFLRQQQLADKAEGLDA